MYHLGNISFNELLISCLADLVLTIWSDAQTLCTNISTIRLLSGAYLNKV
jgi:hypothetical protein